MAFSYRTQSGSTRGVDFIAEGAKNKEHAEQAVYRYITREDHWILDMIEEFGPPRVAWLGYSAGLRVRVSER